MSFIKIGWAEENITPNKPVKLAGQFYERISENIESPIMATAMALEAEEDSAVICSCDICAIAANLVEMARERLRDIPGLAPDKVVFHAVHNHTSLLYERKNATKQDYRETFRKHINNYVESIEQRDDVMNPQEALIFLADKLALVVRHAWESRGEGSIRFGFGRAAVGMCRRVVYKDGSAKMWGDTNLPDFDCLEGGNDSGLELMYTSDATGITGVVINIACPAQIVEQRSFISADYWGVVRKELDKKFGHHVYVLGLCSVAGDQGPRDLVRWVEPETPVADPNIHHNMVFYRRADPSMFDISGMRVVGRRIANEVASVYEDIINTSVSLQAPVLRHIVCRTTLPIRRVTEEEYRESLCKILEYGRSGEVLDYSARAELHIHAGPVERWEVQKITDEHPVELHFIRVGDCVFATNPFELFLNYGNRIRARSRAAQTFLMQLTCGADGYLPTEKAEKAGHYSAYVSSGVCGHEGGNRLTELTISEINRLFIE